MAEVDYLLTTKVNAPEVVTIQEKSQEAAFS